MTGVGIGPLVDHHCHGLVATDLGRAGFEALMNEGSRPSPLGTTSFDSMLGLAVRRWCAPVLGLPAGASADDYLARRADLGADEVNRRLVAAAGIDCFLVDTGLTPSLLCRPDELAAMADGSAREIVRLERVAEQALADGTPADGFAETVVGLLRGSDAVAFKSIAAYRVGLALPGQKPSDDDLVQTLAPLVGTPGAERLAHPVVSAWLAWTAIELGLPLQFHVGYGDSDLDLLQCDPLRLTAFLRATEERGVPVMLLHNYPYHRNAAYLAQVFEHVFVDVGLATHNSGALSTGILRETLEVVPFGKLLFSSDAYGLAELYLLGAHLFRSALGGVLGSLVDASELGPGDADHVAALVASVNARRVYNLPT